ncbi:hypothetical protein Y1Q_0009886 [Alligator mississippiensis]|uniref:Uncharacterized protein n=1 Tax=Alligator mississippiensis TaxID=8496 RepID=A0A151MX93_ALLMI|nr:hypothetical protein Y1Q_0009886 [Alligator mississippiensis]
MVRMRTQEVEARIQLFARKQDLCEKIEAQQISLVREGDGPGLPRMSVEDYVEAYLEAFERAVMATKLDPGSWVAKLGPLLIGPAQAAYRALNRVQAWDYKKIDDMIEKVGQARFISTLDLTKRYKQQHNSSSVQCWAKMKWMKIQYMCMYDKQSLAIKYRRHNKKSGARRYNIPFYKELSHFLAMDSVVTTPRTYGTIGTLGQHDNWMPRSRSPGGPRAQGLLIAVALKDSNSLVLVQ